MVVSDYFGVMGFQDADRMIRGGNDCMLVAYDTDTNHLTDTTSGTSLLAARQACKNILYTVVNSRAYVPANLHTGMLGWQKVAVTVDVILAILVLALAATAFKRFKKSSKA